MEVMFEHAIYLWFFLSLPLLIIVHFFTLRYAQGKSLEFANFAALARVARTPLLSKNLTLLVIRMFTLSCIVLAVAGTTIWYSGLAAQSDFVLALDTSSSMLADDYTPNRLGAAKKAATDFINGLPERTKVGLVSFAGTAFVLQRPTEDFLKLKDKIDTLEIQTVGGTDIGEAIITAANLISTEKEGNAVVLLTDGRSNVGIQPFEAANYANDNHVTLYTIGVGTEEGGAIEGTSLVLSLDEESLKDMAARTGGQYFRAKTEEELKEAYEEITKASIKEISWTLTSSLILLALLASLLDWFLVNTRYRRIP